MNLIRNLACTKKHLSSEFDPDQGKGITQILKFAAEHLNDRLHLHTSGVSDVYSEFPTTPQHDQTLVNHNDEFPVPL